MGVRYGWAWRRLRSRVLAEEGYRCRQCGGHADQVDHIVPLIERPDLELVRSNCQAMCRRCNLLKELARRAEAAAIRPGFGARRAW